MKILSLFDGISCAMVACERAGIEVDTYFASEIDKYAIQISQKNYPKIVQLGDVKEINRTDFLQISNEIGATSKIDLLIGGSPCQDLSIAKKDRKGLDGERSGLFWEYVRILNEVKPKYFILENVNSMPKKDKEIISQTLCVEPVMINASLVSAQNRKRLFWVGRLDEFGTYKQVEIPQPKDRGILLKDILEPKVDEKFYVKDKSNTIRTSGRGSGINDRHNWDTIRIGSINSGGQGDRIYSPDGKSVNLSANGGGRGAKTGLYAVAVAQRGRNIVNGKRKDVLGAKTKQRFEFGGEKSNTITKVQKDSYVLQDTQIRKLTPIECERLMTLPDGFTEFGINEKGEKVKISNTQRYKTLGNGFVCDVVSHIIKCIDKDIKKHTM